MDTYGLVCICGKSADQHAGMDHPFLEKRPDYDPSTWLRAAFPYPTKAGPPSTVYIQLEDRLQVVQTHVAGAASATISVRILRPDGTIIGFTNPLIGGGSRAAGTQTFDLVEGYLLGIAVTNQNVNDLRGDFWVAVSLIRGAGAAAFTEQVLLADYVTNTAPIGWPGGRIGPSVEGQGRVNNFATSTPAAGTELLFTIPARSRWRVRSIIFSLTTSATVANREVTLVIDFATAPLVQVPSGFTQAASLTRTYSFALGVQLIQGAQALLTSAPLPDALITNGGRVRTITTNLQGADQYTAAVGTEEEWVE